MAGFVLCFGGLTRVLADAPAIPNAVAYDEGRYDDAVTLGVTDGSAAALVLVARARLAKIDLGLSDNHKADAKAAMRDAEKAMELDPANAEAHLMKVAALGMLARGMSKMKSFRKGMAGKSRKHIEAALELDPDSAWAQAMLGMWHLEIVRRGGKFGARVTGANAKKGAAECAQAMQSERYDAGMGTQCGLALLICTEDFADQAKATLQQASLSSQNGVDYDRAMSARARDVLNLWDTQGLDAARAQALAYLKYTAS